MAKKSETLTIKEIYSEIGVNYRFFLNWRHALFAGYLLVLFTLSQIFIWVFENAKEFLLVIYFFGVILSLCFWGLERRVRDLYQACTKAGQRIEDAVGEPGIYTSLDSDVLRRKKISHSGVLDWFFFSVTMSFLIVFVVSLASIFSR